MENKYCCLSRDGKTGIVTAYESFEELYKSLIKLAKERNDGTTIEVECGYTLDFLQTCLDDRNTNVIVKIPNPDEHPISYDVKIGEKIEKIAADSIDINFHGLMAVNLNSKILFFYHLNDEIGRKSY